MVKFRPHIAFSIVLFIYFLVRFYRHSIPSEFIKYHVTDLLFVPFIFLFALILTRWFKRDEKITIHPIYIVILSVGLGVYFEWYLPHYGFRENIYTADWKDVIMYLLGGAWCIWFQKKTLATI